MKKWIPEQLTKEDMQMTNKHMKRRSISYVIRQMQIKIKKYLYIPIKMAQIWNPDNTKCWGGCAATVFIQCWWECKNGTATLEASLVVFYKT